MSENERTPIVENQDFLKSSSNIPVDEEEEENGKKKWGSKNLHSWSPPRSTSSSSPSSSSSEVGEALQNPEEQEKHPHPQQHSHLKLSCGGAGGGGGKKMMMSTSGIKKRNSSGRALSEMSGSYHEIFDSQMPPGAVGGGPASSRTNAEDDDDDEGDDVSGGDCYYNNPDEGILVICPDENTQKTTEYLTRKLVQDSLKWQREHPNMSSLPPTPQKMKKVKENILDPKCINDIERHARHLASSVDNLVESLSGILHGISALTVDSVNVYRDGVCKTCDEVDNNIKSMYQLMAKVEELNKAMGPAYKFGEQIKDVKKLLDQLEAADK